jgi:hypothetical protein
MFRYERGTDVVQIDAVPRETLKKSSAFLRPVFVNNFPEIQLVFRIGAT